MLGQVGGARKLAVLERACFCVEERLVWGKGPCGEKTGSEETQENVEELQRHDTAVKSRPCSLTSFI